MERKYFPRTEGSSDDCSIAIMHAQVRVCVWERTVEHHVCGSVCVGPSKVTSTLSQDLVTDPVTESHALYMCVSMYRPGACLSGDP